MTTFCLRDIDVGKVRFPWSYNEVEIYKQERILPSDMQRKESCFENIQVWKATDLTISFKIL